MPPNTCTSWTLENASLASGARPEAAYQNVSTAYRKLPIGAVPSRFAHRSIELLRVAFQTLPPISLPALSSSGSNLPVALSWSIRRRLSSYWPSAINGPMDAEQRSCVIAGPIDFAAELVHLEREFGTQTLAEKHKPVRVSRKNLHRAGELLPELRRALGSAAPVAACWSRQWAIADRVRVRGQSWPSDSRRRAGVPPSNTA